MRKQAAFPLVRAAVFVLVSSGLSFSGVFAMNMPAPSVNARASDSSGPSSSADKLAAIQVDCGKSHGPKFFGAQVKCIKEQIQFARELTTGPFSGDLNLYVLTAESLVDEVGRKVISQVEARVELQRAFLEFRDRVNRQIANAAASENAARLQALHAADVEREQETRHRAELQASEDARFRALQEENQEQAHLKELKRMKELCIATMTGRGDSRGDFNPAGIAMCYSDPYAHLRPENQPKPATNCVTQVVGQYGYVTCQ